jgi:hypothetical protein
MAKQIQPQQVWVNGESKSAEFLDANGINVVLFTTGGFYWTLWTKVVDSEGNDVPGEQIAQGNLQMTTEEYQLWQEDEYAIKWVASKLNLVILP